MDRQRDGKSEYQREKLIDIQPDPRQMNRQLDRQVDRQMDR